MNLFSEKEMFNSTGTCAEASPVSEETLLKAAVHPRYGKDSLVTYVDLNADDWPASVRDRRRDAYRFRICFTPIEGYEEHRKELAETFPFAFVLQVENNPFGELSTKAYRTMKTLFSQNYVILPMVDSHKSRGWRPGGSPHIMNSYAPIYVIDAFAGGDVVTNIIPSTLGRNKNKIAPEMHRIWYSQAMFWMMHEVAPKFEKDINLVEEMQ